jgi:ABC-type Zn uptake system ZnuABC Zn-binding protein ZnuA
MLLARRFQDAAIASLILAFAASTAAANPVRVGVTEYVYQDLAEQIGGKLVKVTLLHNPASASQLPPLDLVICGRSNGETHLRDVIRHLTTPPFVIEVSSSTQFPWYDVQAMADLSQQIATELKRRTPADALKITANARNALTAFHAFDRRIEEVAKVYANSDVLLGDTLYEATVERLRFKIRNQSYLKSFRPGAPPAAKSIANVTEAIQRREGSIFIYDKDAAGPAITQLVDLANNSGVPVVALHEQLPKGVHYQQWMLRQLNAVHGALNEASP